MQDSGTVPMPNTLHVGSGQITLPLRAQGGRKPIPSRSLPHGRLDYLDSLRGLAAMVVVVHHCLVVYPAMFSVHLSGQPKTSTAIFLMAYTPLHLVWDGPAAVNVFFVLSGLVLALMLQDGRMSYRSYLARRMTRLYTPYLFAVVLAGILAGVFGGIQVRGYSTWVDQWWTGPMTARAALAHVFMFGFGQYNRFDPVIWSLVQEMRISVIFPGLVHE